MSWTFVLMLAMGAETFDLELDDEELLFLAQINAYREAAGAPCLKPSHTLSAAAHYMSEAMGKEGFFCHQEPPCDGAGENCVGRDPFDRIDSFGHRKWTVAAENIAGGNKGAKETFRQWQTSLGHNENMLDPEYTAIGIARVFVSGSEFGWYWTNTFSDWVDSDWSCEGTGTGFRELMNIGVASVENAPSQNTPSQNAPSQNDGGGCASSPWPLLLFLLVRRRLVSV
ncbi:MAG: CAP domain-containing protein [Myxococcota bacterium]|nr:CAP domain-containing protein [Myxococcota bacterium]